MWILVRNEPENILFVAYYSMLKANFSHLGPFFVKLPNPIKNKDKPLLNPCLTYQTFLIVFCEAV